MPSGPTTDAKRLESIAVAVATEAAAFVRQFLGTATQMRTKSTPTDVVTETDVAAEEFIRRRLAQLSPGSSVMGEELDDHAGTTGVGWVIDPIDGTVNFLYDLPAVSVSIAATLNGEVVAGAVTDVVHNETFSASLGGGARQDGRPIAVSDPGHLAQAMVITGFSYDRRRRGEQGKIVAGLLDKVRDIRCFGSAALHLCWVGCGRADAFYEDDLEPWDIAAGALIAAEAGATVQYPERLHAMILVATPSIFEPLRDLITPTS